MFHVGHAISQRTWPFPISFFSLSIMGTIFYNIYSSTQEAGCADRFQRLSINIPFQRYNIILLGSLLLQLLSTRGLAVISFFSLSIKGMSSYNVYHLTREAGCA